MSKVVQRGLTGRRMGVARRRRLSSALADVDRACFGVGRYKIDAPLLLLDDPASSSNFRHVYQRGRSLGAY